ncbi:hypothetical protein [Amycolatopsis xylanica]|uniref:hypothetical protein n=1 Tax=Amycolatopsis xylanica TaxID=589385 RepID=UPI00115FBCFE|nr:hypothetical protein [Amycolatopsis xylanica]
MSDLGLSLYGPGKKSGRTRVTRNGSDCIDDSFQDHETTADDVGIPMPETFEMDRVDRIADILYGVASGEGLIQYAPLGRRVGVRPDHLGHFLDQVSTRAVRQGEPMWSALVVSKESGAPSVGFYGLGRRLRNEYHALDDASMWIRERQRCYEAARVA